MVNSGSKDKHVLKTTICKRRDSEDVQQIIAFAYLLINPLAVFMCKGQDHCVMILNQPGVHLPQTAVFFVLNAPLVFTDGHFLCRFPMSLVSANRWETEDILEMVWAFFGSWWPSWSECSMTFSSRSFSAFRQPSSLYHSPGSAIAQRQPLSNASTLDISSEHDYVLCKCNIQGVNTRERKSAVEGVQSISSPIPQRNILSFKMLLKARLQKAFHLQWKVISSE